MVQHRPHIARQIFQIPLVDKAVDLTAFFARGVGGIHVIHHRDEPNPPLDKLAVQVFFHQLHVAGEARLRFCQNYLKPPMAGCLDHPGEVRAVAVDARIVLVAVDAVDLVSVVHRVLDQHGFLVLDALGFLCAALQVLVLFAQTAVDRGFHAHPSLVRSQDTAPPTGCLLRRCAGRILDSVFKVEREKLPDCLPALRRACGEKMFLHDVSGLFHDDASLCEIAAQKAAFSYYVVKKAMMPRKACPMGARTQKIPPAMQWGILS